MQCNDFTAYFRYDCKVASKSCPSSLAPTVGTVGHQRMVFHPNRLVKKIDKRLQITGLSLLSWWTDHQYRCHDLRRRHGGQRHAERRPEGLRNHKTSHDGIAMVSQKHAITYVDGLKLSYSYHKIWYWASICQVFFLGVPQDTRIWPIRESIQVRKWGEAKGNVVNGSKLNGKECCVGKQVEIGSWSLVSWKCP